jgi:hypothetical protein
MKSETQDNLYTHGSYYCSENRISKDGHHSYRRFSLEPGEMWAVDSKSENTTQFCIHVKDKCSEGNITETRLYIPRSSAKLVERYWVKIMISETSDVFVGYIHTKWIPPDIKQSIFQPEILWNE